MAKSIAQALAERKDKKPPVPAGIKPPKVGSKAAEWDLYRRYQRQAVGVWRQDRGNT